MQSSVLAELCRLHLALNMHASCHLQDMQVGRQGGSIQLLEGGDAVGGDADASTMEQLQMLDAAPCKCASAALAANLSSRV